MSSKFFIALAAFIVTAAGLFAANIYVDGSNASSGAGTTANPYKYIQTAINTASNNQQANTIYIRGRGTATYTQNLSISGFQYALTLKRWATYPAEVFIKGTGTSASTVYLNNNSAIIKLNELTISRASAATNLLPGGGGIAVYNSNSVIINNCIIRNCNARYGGGVYASGSNVQILKSKLYENTGLPSTGGLIVDSYGGAIYGTSSTFDVDTSLFYSNCGPIGTIPTDTFSSFYLTGGSLSFDSSTLGHYAPDAVGGMNFTHSYVNSIIYQPNPSVPGSYMYCCSTNTNLTSFPGEGNIIANPQFTDPSAGDYSLVWSESVKSPCIGTGYDINYDDPLADGLDQNLRTVLDETQDMGGVNYALDRYASYSFTNDAQGNWMCFPVIDDKSHITMSGVSYRADVMKAYFRQYQPQGSVLNNVSTKWYYLDNANNAFNLLSHTPSVPNTWHHMQGFLGYKAVFSQASTMNELHGNHIPIGAAVQVPEANTESWIGYFIPYTQTPQDAFGTFLDEVYYIQHKDWVMVRAKPKRGSAWTSTPGPSLSYGDMVIVKKFAGDDTNPEVDSFVWQSISQAPQYVREATTYYSYAKEPDYTPVFVQLDPLSSAQEIAVLVNGECKGAAVVDNNLVMVQAFISSVPDGAEIQLVTWDGAKAATKPLSFNMYDPTSGRFIPANSLVKQDVDFYSVKLGNLDSANVPEAVALAISNYPNPFNPRTTISYNLPKDGKVNISIYNIKGQLVKILLNEPAKSGVHSIVWNGEDHSGSKVSAGLYFTRIEANGNTLTNKMLMLK